LLRAYRVEIEDEAGNRKFNLDQRALLQKVLNALGRGTIAKSVCLSGMAGGAASGYCRELQCGVSTISFSVKATWSRTVTHGAGAATPSAKVSFGFA